MRCNWQQIVLDALPNNLQSIIMSLPQYIANFLEEIRIREGRPLMVYSNGKSYFISINGQPCKEPSNAYYIKREDSKSLLQLISNYSIYALEEELKNGYITLKGGYRVGITGKAVLENGRVKTLKYINSFNIRISREIIGAANKLLPYIIKDQSVYHTLILSPPQMGKTTLLRDVARQLSNGYKDYRGVKIGIVDERSEIAGCFEGIPQNDVGIQTDILDGCPKAEGIMMLIRSMSPNIIITDEIGKMEDIESIEEALNAGIKIIASAHARGIEDAHNRPILSHVLDKKLFQRIVVLGDSCGVGTLESVYDGRTLDNILSRPVR